MYGIPRGWGGTCTPQSITDQITDQYAPYCDELGYAVSNETRVLDVIRLRVRASNPSSGHQNYTIVIIYISNLVSIMVQKPN